MALVSLSYGHMLGHVVGEGHWYRGNPEFRFELFTGQNRTRQLAEIREHQAHDVTALETAVKLSSERYVAGKASYYEVLEAQQQLFPSQNNLARTQRDQLLAVVTLYKDLGGGWQDELKPNQHP